MKIKTIKKYSATWCAPCRQFAPIFEEVKKMEEYKDIEFEEIDVNEADYSEIEKYQIKNIPSIIFIDEENNLMKKLVGGLSKTDFIKIINDTLNE